jgi:DnaJ family protein C protein 2
MIFHPDKVRNQTDKAKTARYKAIQTAYDTFTNVHTRLVYDSSQDFDDSIPSKNDDFDYTIYREAFNKFSHYSAILPVLGFGDENTPIDDVIAFYDFWFNFRSWRDFSFAGEHDINNAENRTHRRWMHSENKTVSKGLKKKETAKIKSLTRNAQNQDPRWKSPQYYLQSYLWI